MSLSREQQTHYIGDLENAMKIIGRILVDATVTPKQRIAQATGILRMYGCEAPTLPAAVPLESEARS